MANKDSELDLNDLAEATTVPETVLIEMIQEGIIAPVGQCQKSWRFDINMVVITQKAFRLHRDLDIDWPGIALALDLINEVEKLRQENEQLKLRLNRFLST